MSLDVGHCTRAKVDENQLSSAHSISNTTKFKNNKKITPSPHNNRAKWLLLKASSNLSNKQIFKVLSVHGSHDNWINHSNFLFLKVFLLWLVSLTKKFPKKHRLISNILFCLISHTIVFASFCKDARQCAIIAAKYHTTTICPDHN